jgi:hypothetical protein
MEKINAPSGGPPGDPQCRSTLWLGHESTRTVQAYLHADMALKERALARTKPQDTPHGRYRAPDQLINFLNNL